MTSPSSHWWLPVLSLWRREVVRFVRQRSRVVGALGTPIVFWGLIGSGLRNSFKLTGGAAPVDYLQFAFPGTLVLIVLFTAIFSMISIIEDRREGFLQAVLAAPVRRSAIVVGKVMGCSTLAFAQAVLFLAAAPLVGVSLDLASVLATLGVLVLLSIGLSGLGFLAAWPMDSTQGFHSVMNLLLMPMWLLSGSFFPASGASSWIGWVMMINPLTYGVASLRYALYLSGPAPADGMPSMAVCLGITIAFCVATLALSARAVARKSL